MIDIKLKPTARNLGFIIGLAVILIVVAPLLVIWSLNTLFPNLAIPYSIETWAAVLVLSNVSKSAISNKKD